MRFPEAEGIDRTIMTYELVKNPTREHYRMASPYEAAAIEAVKGGVGDPAARRINRRFTNYVHDNKLWILCVCLGQGIRETGDRSPSVRTGHRKPRQHAQCGCSPRGSLRPSACARTAARLNAVPDDFLDPFPFVKETSDPARTRRGKGKAREPRRSVARPGSGQGVEHPQEVDPGGAA